MSRMQDEEIYDKVERAEEEARIIRAHIKGLLNKFRVNTGGATISRVSVARDNVDLCVRFPKSWRPFRGYRTEPSRRK